MHHLNRLILEARHPGPGVPGFTLKCVLVCVCVLSYRYKDGKPINQRPEFKMKRMRMQPQHTLEIRDVCQEDFGLYTVVLKNSGASLETRLNLTLIVNGNSRNGQRRLLSAFKKHMWFFLTLLLLLIFSLPLIYFGG